MWGFICRCSWYCRTCVIRWPTEWMNPWANANHPPHVHGKAHHKEDITFRRSSFSCSSSWVDEHKAPTMMLIYSSAFMTESCSKMLSEAPRYHSLSRKILMKGTMPWSFRTTADQRDSMELECWGPRHLSFNNKEIVIESSLQYPSLFLLHSHVSLLPIRNVFQTPYPRLKWEEEKRNCGAEN